VDARDGSGGDGQAPRFRQARVRTRLKRIIPVADLVIGLCGIVLRSLIAPLYPCFSVGVSTLAALGLRLALIKWADSGGLVFFMPFLMSLRWRLCEGNTNTRDGPGSGRRHTEASCASSVQGMPVTGTTVTSAGSCGRIPVLAVVSRVEALRGPRSGISAGARARPS